MKFLTLICCILLIGFVDAGLFAGQVYTWTDENGNLHVTDTPPPPSARVKDTLEYEEKTAAETQRLQSLTEKRDAERVQENKIRRVQEAKRIARQADKAAKLAAERADQISREVEIYVGRLSSTKEKRRQFKKRIQRETDRANAAQASARLAAEEAAQAAEEVRLAEEALKTQSP